MHNTHHIYLIAAADSNFGIGKQGDLPWRLKKELAYFTRVTTTTEDPHKQHMVVMGQRTWESLPPSFRPLPHRKNVVLTDDASFTAEGAEVAHSLEEAYDTADDSIESIFIIGGGYTYKTTIDRPETDGVYLTHVEGDFGCDTFFPPIPEVFSVVTELGHETEGNISFTFKKYERP
ncbi:MAG: dihydrofolate reductase [Candidatus Doudnabacteria bacterium]|nr:dihydrofolate reductase [Candidatus Doudnabacteria bacterium]